MTMNILGSIFFMGSIILPFVNVILMCVGNYYAKEGQDIATIWHMTFIGLLSAIPFTGFALLIVCIWMLIRHIEITFFDKVWDFFNKTPFVRKNNV